MEAETEGKPTGTGEENPDDDGGVSLDLAMLGFDDELEDEGQEADEETEILAIDEQFDYEEEEDEEEEEEEEEETEVKEPLKFHGAGDDDPADERQSRLLAALKKRDFAQEQAENPFPEMKTKMFDLSLSEERRLKLLAQFPSTLTMRRFERPYTPVELTLCTDYQTQLPRIGQVRKVKRERPKKEEMRKTVEITMPPEEPVVNPFFYPDNIPSFMAASEEERLSVNIFSS